MKKEEIEKIGTEVHNGKYKYIFERDEYRVNDKIKCICPEHGAFEQILRMHLKGAGCRQCSQIKNAAKTRLTFEQFKEKSFKVHHGKYDESKVDYKNSETKICIICHEKDYNGKEHGEFWITPLHYLSGQGCKKCNKPKFLKEEIIDKCNKVLKENDCSLKEDTVIDMDTKIICFCKKHGKFEKYPYQIINRGETCHLCAVEKAALCSRKTHEDFISEIKFIHGNKYDLSNVKYEVGYKTIYPICHKTYKNGKEHGAFPITPNNFLQGYGCPKCSRLNSNEEKELSNFIMEFDKSCILSDRKILEGHEIDVLSTDNNIAFEFDGLYWHSDKYCDNMYHLNKTIKSEMKGIKLYHIFEDEWLNKKNIVKSKIKSILGKTDYRIFARKCKIKKIDSKTLKDFLDFNHLQGNINSSYRYGLFYNDELVSVMSFGSLRKSLGSKNDEKTYEMLRFCNKLNTTVVGGASKLLKHFIREVHPKRIISYADRRWSNGNLYIKLGFKHTHDSRPNYFYIIGHKRENRFKYRKDVLVKQGFDPSKSERQIMQERGIHRIYDCGSMVFEMRL